MLRILRCFAVGYLIRSVWASGLRFPQVPADWKRSDPIAQGFNWTECGIGNITRQCSRFEVPLDWHNVSAGKASLLVARHPATMKPKLGTLFMNPGGPGGSGFEHILGSDIIMETVGGHYDILSWDPRGVGLTVPRATCFDNTTEESAFWRGTIAGDGMEVKGNFSNQRDLDVLYAQANELDELLKEMGERCLAHSPNTFQYIGSAAAVRDMVAMHDILEGPNKLVDYWGLSYGTIIGIYFANMFPNRVGRVILDGVLDPVYYSNKPAHEMWGIKTESSDEAFIGFASACAAAGPSGCAIAKKDSTTDSIRKWVYDLIDAMYDYKQREQSAGTGSSGLRWYIYDGLYAPTRWPELATELAQLYQVVTNSSQGSANLGRVMTSSSGGPLSGFAPAFSRRETGGDSTHTSIRQAPDFSYQGITCGDAIDMVDVRTKDVLDFLVHVTRNVSSMFGPMWGEAGQYCHKWPVRAVERYTGPWNKKLVNPILVIGNEADPVTPFISAKRVADALGESAILIEQDDYGHLSLAMRSNCTMSAIQDYLLNKKLPHSDKFCGTNQILFPGPGVTKNTLSKAGADDALLVGGKDSLKNELDGALKRNEALLTVMISLASLTGFIMVSLLVFCLWSPRKRAQSHTIHTHRWMVETLGDGQGHTYRNPFEDRLGLKPNGYSRVVSRSD